MSPLRIVSGILICAAACFRGATFGLAMGGYGMCAIDFSLGLAGGAAFLGAVFGGIIALLWPKVWWAGALAFSILIPLEAGLPIAAGEWRRVAGMLVCVAAAMGAAFLVRFPGPKSQKQEANTSSKKQV